MYDARYGPVDRCVVHVRQSVPKTITTAQLCRIHLCEMITFKMLIRRCAMSLQLATKLRETHVCGIAQAGVFCCTVSVLVNIIS